MSWLFSVASIFINTFISSSIGSAKSVKSFSLETFGLRSKQRKQSLQGKIAKKECQLYDNNVDFVCTENKWSEVGRVIETVDKGVNIAIVSRVLQSRKLSVNVIRFTKFIVFILFTRKIDLKLDHFFNIVISVIELFILAFFDDVPESSNRIFGKILTQRWILFQENKEFCEILQLIFAKYF